MATMPWEYSEPGTPETGVPNLPSPEGAELGEHFARFVEHDEPAFRERHPHAPEMCHDCAFRRGTIPNQSAVSLMDALKCLMEGERFDCHVENHPCVGYAILKEAGDAE